EHLRHAMIAFRRFEKADASIVSVTDLPGELLLPELTLHPSAVSAGAEREARDFDIRFAQRDPIRSGPFTAAGLCYGARSTESGQNGSGHARFQKITSG